MSVFLLVFLIKKILDYIVINKNRKINKTNIYYMDSQENKFKSVEQIIKYIKKHFKYNVILVFIILSTISNTIILYLNYDYDNRYTDIEKEEVNIIATIVSTPIEKEYKYVCKIKIESINKNKKYKGTHLQLSIPKRKGEEGRLLFIYGDVIKFNGIYEKGTVQRNYKGFSYCEYLKSIKIYGTIKSSSNIDVLKKDNISIITKLANSANNKISYSINEILPERTKYLFLGILIGDTVNVSDEIEEDFKDSNLSHMLAVSGSHITYIIISISFVTDKIKYNKRKSKILICISLIFFMYITGFSASVVRACIMGIIILLSGLFYRKADIWSSISLSLLIILIVNPFSIKDIGLILSFGGTIGIIVFYKNILNAIGGVKSIDINYKKVNKELFLTILKKTLNIVKENFAVTISAQIVIFPIMILNFGTVSFTFFISNILAGPIIGFITIFGFICVSISFISINLGCFFSLVLNFFLEILLSIAKYIAILPLSKVYVIIPSTLTVLSYYITIFCINYIFLSELAYTKYPRRLKNNYIDNDNNYINMSKTRRIENILHIKRKIFESIKREKEKLKTYYRIISILIIGLIFIFIMYYKSPKDLKIFFIDVGQGDSTLIVTPYGKKVLIDGGGSRDMSSFDVGESTIVPYLLKRKIRTLDYVMISHFDADHCNRFNCSIRKFKCKKSYNIKTSKYLL